MRRSFAHRILFVFALLSCSSDINVSNIGLGGSSCGHYYYTDLKWAKINNVNYDYYTYVNYMEHDTSLSVSGYYGPFVVHTGRNHIIYRRFQEGILVAQDDILAELEVCDTNDVTVEKLINHIRIVVPDSLRIAAEYLTDPRIKTRFYYFPYNPNEPPFDLQGWNGRDCSWHWYNNDRDAKSDNLENGKIIIYENGLLLMESEVPSTTNSFSYPTTLGYRYHAFLQSFNGSNWVTFSRLTSCW